MTDFEAKVAKLREAGATIERPVEEFEGWTFGERVRVVEDDEDNGLFEGDEGTLVPEEVGAPEYGNVQVKLYLLIDDTDCPIGVTADQIEPA